MPAPRGLPAWAADYIGLPYRQHGRTRDGIDCYGLLLLVLREQFGLEPPDHADAYGEETTLRGLSRLLGLYRVEWSPVQPGSERLGDAVLIERRGLPIHCGLVVASGWMLHCETGADSVLERYDGPAWGTRAHQFGRWLAPLDGPDVPESELMFAG